MISSLPFDTLVHVMQLAGQPARVACMVTSKALSAAALAPNTWHAVHFALDLDRSALRFMRRQRCGRVTISTDCPDDVVWFLDALADQGLYDVIESLVIRVGIVQRLPRDFMHPICRHEMLWDLSVHVEDLLELSEVVFPSRRSGLRQLRFFRVSECGSVSGSKKLVVLMRGQRFPSLQSLRLDVGESDVMRYAKTAMPRLRRLVYLHDPDDAGETLEDALFAGVQLDHLELEVTDDTDVRHLSRQLQASRVRRLVLHVNNDTYVDLSRPLSPYLQELRLVMSGVDGQVNLDFPHLAGYKQLRCLRVEVAPWVMPDQPDQQECTHHVSFSHVGRPADWAALFTRVELDVYPTVHLGIKLQ